MAVKPPRQVACAAESASQVGLRWDCVRGSPGRRAAACASLPGAAASCLGEHQCVPAMEVAMKAPSLRRLGAVLVGVLALALTCSACQAQQPKPAAAPPGAPVVIHVSGAGLTGS